MHEITGEHWHEPEGMKNAGYGAWKRPNTPYDDYMEAQGIPIFRGIGVRRVQDMPLKRWNRMGGNGTFIQLYGTEGRWGCYVIEVPGAGALNPERHMYEEIMVVVEGRGTTEVWTDDQKKPHSFEWQRGSMFSIPLNTWHRIINAASSPALILVASTAPNVMNIFRDTDWIFNCPVTFPSRFDGSDNYFKPKDDVAPDALRGLAMRRTNLVPDIFNAELYLDNRRSPGYRRLEPALAGNVFYQFVGEHITGRYSKAHAHAVGGGARLHQGQGLHLYVAARARHDAVAGRQGRPGLSPGLRAGRRRHRGALWRRLVPRPFRHQQGAAAADRLVRPQQPPQGQGRRPRREGHRRRRDRRDGGRHRDSLLARGSVSAQGIRGDPAREGVASQMEEALYRAPAKV